MATNYRIRHRQIENLRCFLCCLVCICHVQLDEALISLIVLLFLNVRLDEIVVTHNTIDNEMLV